MDVLIELVALGDTRAEDEKTEIFARLVPVSRNEFSAAGQAGYHELRRFDIWTSEFDDQEEVIYNGKRLTIYRTYGPRQDGITELYTAERVGTTND